MDLKVRQLLAKGLIDSPVDLSTKNKDLEVLKEVRLFKKSWFNDLKSLISSDYTVIIELQHLDDIVKLIRKVLQHLIEEV